MIRRALLLAALAAAACSSSQTQLGTTVRLPVSVAFYDGRTTKLPGLVHRYMAVAAFAGNELILVDPQDDKAVIGPGLVFPLSVPTAPGPTFLASTSLGDGSGRPDLLVVAGQQAPGPAASPIQQTIRIEAVATWQELTTVAPDAVAVDLVAELQATDPTIADAQLLSLVALPVPGRPGRACVVAALSGGRLAVIPYERDPSSPLDAVRRVPNPAVPGTSLVYLVPTVTVSAAAPAGTRFEPVSLALGPAPDGLLPDPPNTRRIFAATGEALGDASGATVHGVAQITAAFDAAGLPALPWAMVGLDALAPTRLVAAQLVSERDPAAESVEQLDRVMKLRVYAQLDESACGRLFPIDCGIATLVPDDPTRRGGIAADPVGELPYRAPMRVPGYALAMVAAAPSALRATPSYVGNDPNPADPRFRVMVIDPGTGQRDASAVLAVASADGKLYMYDVARWDVGLAVSQMRGGSPAGTVAGTAGLYGPGLPIANAPDPSAVTDPPGNKNYPVLTVWDDYTSPAPAVKKAIHRDASNLPKSIEPDDVTSNVKAPPGYAQSDSWAVRWHGALPGLSSRYGEVGLLDPVAGTGWVAAQQPGPAVDPGTGQPIPVVWMDATQPEIGVHVGDFVDLDLDPTVCTGTPPGVTAGRLRARVTGFLPPDPLRYPAGALSIDRISDPAAGAECPAPVVTPAAPLGNAYLTVRAQGFVLIGTSFGYAGRPEVSGTMVETSPTEADAPRDPRTVAAQTFYVRWEDEGALRAQIAAAPDAATRRPFQERLAIAQKARRNFYPADEVCGSGSTLATDLACAQWNAGWDPTFAQDTTTTPRPPPDRYVLRFRLAIFCRGTTPATACVPADQMLDDTALLFSTNRGVVEWTRRPPTGGTAPRALGWLDKSVYDPTGGVTQFVVGFSDNQVIDFSPGSPTSTTNVVR